MNLLSAFNQNNINWATYAGGIALAILICFVAYVLIMGVYIFTRKRRPSAKYAIELTFILIGLIFSVAIKLLILADLELGSDNVDYGVGDYLAYSFSAIYSLVGSLQFEGLPFSFTDMPALQTCLYYGSSIIAGLILLSVITAKASYEIYSIISLRFTKFINYFTKRNSVYIFNSLTKDAIILAKSIKEQNKHSVIIFAGDNIPSFSRGDALCREVMSNSFYYYSLSSGNDTKKALLYRLKLNTCNVSMLTFDMENQNQPNNDKASNSGKRKKVDTQRRICEFYFELDEDKKPNQERNTVDAFNELDLILQRTFTLKSGIRTSNATKGFVEKLNSKYGKTTPCKSEELEKICIEYFHELAKISHWLVSEHYILTFTSSNYEYYTRTLHEKIWKIIESLFAKISPLLLSSKDFNQDLMTEKYSEFFNRMKACEENKNDNKKYENVFAATFLKAMLNYLTASNQVHVVNEAHLTSISLVEKRSEAIVERAKYERKIQNGDEYPKEDISPEMALLNHLGYAKNSENYKALILGFGGNGQSALNALFFDSAIITESCGLNGFYADVFDKNIDDLGAIFAKNHPLYRCFTTVDGKPVSMSSAENVYNTARKNAKIQNTGYEGVARREPDGGASVIIQNDDIDNVFGGYYQGEDSILDHKDEMTFPLVQFHDKSCTSLDFINFFDAATGSSIEKNKNDYNIIVIAFGSDRKNISIANAIIDDIRRECMYNPKNPNMFKQCIAVNIRDRENLDKLNWTEDDKTNKDLKSICVFSFGAKEDIYSYEKILDYTGQYEYSTNYESMQGLANNENTERLSRDINMYLNNLNEDKAAYKLASIIENVLNLREDANINESSILCNQVSYLKLDNTKMEVNRISTVYAGVMRAMIKKLGKFEKGQYSLDFDAIKALLVLEHEKWCRFYISEGWIYDERRNSTAKTHNCLLPLKFVSYEKYGYDLINVVMQLQKVNSELRSNSK